VRQLTPSRQIAFLISDLARLLKTYVDQQARRYGMTRAQWQVLSRLERCEGLKQSELAEMLDLQPITLTRLVDRLCDNGLIERRPDPNDRRAKRLFLTKEARPLMDRIAVLGEEIMGNVLAGIDGDDVEFMLTKLGRAKENLREAIQKSTEAKNEARYG
jgi:MarR family transcriptional regulator, transcriptional regulator for hemolysin